MVSQRLTKNEFVAKSCPEALLEPKMDPKREPKCIQELPRGAPGAHFGPKMHPNWDAALGHLGHVERPKLSCGAPNGPRPGGMRETIK